MSKAVKALLTAELRARFAGVSSACVVDMTGLNVESQMKLRRTLKKSSARLQVVKNSVARCAFEGSLLAPLGNALEGPCALVTGSESGPRIAKVLLEAAKEFTTLKLKSAIFEGDPTIISVAELAKMRGRAEVLGELAMLISSPGRRLAGCLQAPQARIAGCLKKISEKTEASQPE